MIMNNFVTINLTIQVKRRNSFKDIIYSSYRIYRTYIIYRIYI